MPSPAQTQAPSDAPPQSPYVKSAMREMMRERFKYDTSIRKKAEEDGLVDDSVIRLEAYLVKEEKVSPALVSHMAHQRELFEAAKPSLANGIGKQLSSSASIGVMPYDYNFLPSSKPLPYVRLLNVKF
ncbi:MAG: hypothetical protein QM790_20545 [Nibricoccus sp.]